MKTPSEVEAFVRDCHERHPESAPAFIRATVDKILAGRVYEKVSKHADKEEQKTMEHTELVKALRGAPIERKADVIRKAVQAAIAGNAPPADANWNQRRWAADRADEAISKLVRAEREAQHGPGY